LLLHSQLIVRNCPDGFYTYITYMTIQVQSVWVEH